MKARRVKRLSGKSIREKNVATFAKKSAKWAIKKAANKNVTITIAKKRGIYKIHADGSTELVVARPHKVRVSKKIIKLGA